MIRRLALLIVACCGFVAPGYAEPSDEPTSSTRGDFPAGAAREFELALARAGIRPSLTYLAEPLANVAGGMRRGAIYEGRLDLGVDADLNRLMGWSGAKFHANVFHIHGNGLSREYIGNLMLVSGMEALNHTRLYELWIEQSFGKHFSLRFGQLAADVEFFYSKYAEIFVQSTLGWPVITGVNLPAGGRAADVVGRHSRQGAGVRPPDAAAWDVRRRRRRPGPR